MKMDIAVELFDNTETYFRVILGKGLALDIGSLKWNYNDATKLYIEFEEHMGMPLGEVLNKAVEQEILTLVLIQMKKKRYINWDTWNFEKILADRLKKRA